MKILVIEDEKAVAESIQFFLEQHYLVDIARSAEEGEYKANINDYDIILMDFMLGDATGVSLCRKLRRQNNATPILFLTCVDDIQVKIQALNVGADDYVTKPFSSAELLARIRAVLRRNISNDDTYLSFSNVMLDCTNRLVMHDKVAIPLRRKEYDLLEYFMRNQNKVLSRSMILEHVWEEGIDELSNTLDVHVKFLRDKIDKPFGTHFIKTVHGVGYKLSE